MKKIGVFLMLLMVLSMLPLTFAEDLPAEPTLIAEVINVDVVEDNETNEEEIMEDEEEIDTEEDETNEEEIDTEEDETNEEETVEEEDEDEEEVPEEDEDTIEEVSVMYQGNGAEIRLLQLEKAITNNILHGEVIIPKITEGGEDTADLELIIDDLESLLEEVQALDPEVEDAVEAFVAIKKEAKDLSSEFKRIASGLLSDEDKSELRKKAKQDNHAKVKAISDKVKTKVRKHNAEQLTKTYEILGISDDDVIEQLKNGEITIKEVHESIKEELQSMSKEEKKEAISELKEEGVKRLKNADVAVDKARVKAITKHEERLNKRLAATENIDDEEKKAKIQERLNNQLEKSEAVKEKTEKRLEIHKEKMDKRKEKIQEKTGGDEE